MPAEVVDMFSDFESCWEEMRNKDAEGRLEVWLKKYMSKYPELLRLQVECYEGANWRSIAVERVFSRIEELMPAIAVAHRNSLRATREAYYLVSEFWGGAFDVVFVIYVGIGCGAGWATEYGGKYAVLLGLEMIAELGWQSLKKLRGLAVHELSHVVHMALRGLSPRDFEALEKDPYFLLYSEGFATRCEHIILGEMWRIAPDPSWVKWCRDNLSLLASEYLSRASKGEPVNDFYGSWLSIKGRSQTGYFLGHEFIRNLESEMGIREIARLAVKSVREKAQNFLCALASEGFAK